jgi:hypothetical protein
LFLFQQWKKKVNIFTLLNNRLTSNQTSLAAAAAADLKSKVKKSKK